MVALGFTPAWIVMLIAIGVMAVLVRLAASSRVGLLLFLAIGAGLTLSGLLLSRSVARPVIAHSQHEEVPLQGSRLQPERRTPPPRPVLIESVATSPVEAMSVDDSPPPPPVSILPSPATSPPAAPEARFTVYHGSSTQGDSVDKLPGWVLALADAPPGSDLVTFSSDRFATVDEAEKQLWSQARDFVAHDLRLRMPDAAHWSPPASLLRSRGFIVERCIERTEIAIGKYVEPMYRVHWKASLSNDLRASVVDAWRPAVQERRLEAVALGLLGASGAFAILNLILRSFAARLAARKPSPAS